MSALAYLNNDLSDDDYLKAACLGSYLTFTRYFYKLKTGREFELSEPIGRESHFITIARELKSVFLLETPRLMINIAPGCHKSTMLVYFIAWCYAHYPDCNFLYISYGYELAEKHTATIKEIMEMPIYRKLFGVELRTDSQAKGNFKTTAGGTCVAFGSNGSITGFDAGLPGLDRFSGGVVYDDAHKAKDVHSDTIRESVIDVYNSSVTTRLRGIKVPIIFIGQRLHEEDLPAYLLAGKDGYAWKKIILMSRDLAGNVLHPMVWDDHKLKLLERFDPYNYAAQHLQNPQPAGGGIYKRDWFPLLDSEPNIISTIIVADTAESCKDWADYTVFSFFGVYKLKVREVETGMYGLHWLDCRQIRCEPKDLESEFYDFYASCMRHRIKPQVAAIEKKSTGTFLLSLVKDMPGMRIIEVEHNRNAGSKITRFLRMQPFIAAKQISFAKDAKHVEMCLEHMRKITANESHAHDDVCDTAEMCVKLVLIDGTLIPRQADPGDTIKKLTEDFNVNRQMQQKAMIWD